MAEIKGPIIAVIGRPNVGKSTLFNKLVGRRKAIVQDMPGVTRDRNEALGHYRDRQFTLIDTGGLVPESKEEMETQVRRQSEIAIEQADALLFVMSARDGVTPIDRSIHDLLRKSGKPVYYVINKAEGKGIQRFNEFYELGVDPLYAISAEHNEGLSDLLDALYPRMAPEEEEKKIEAPKVVVLGRPNVGKSTLINTLLREERLVTSDVPGTTRDTIDSWVTYHDKRYLFIDTAGIRRRGKIEHGVEQFSIARAKEALERSDVALLLIDGVEGITEQDSKIAGLIIEKGRGSVVLINKWDLAKKEERAKERLLNQIALRFRFLTDLQYATISAREGEGIGQIFQLIDTVYGGYTQRVSTGDLNRFFEKMMESHPPPFYKGKRLKLYYITQAGVRPPTFVLFANAPKGVPDHYLGYIENQLRETFGFTGTPIRIRLRQRR
ncbi:ribosome biogenesis GTPase Der [Candidatus Manganitrophus noduliformans]|uniref:ribosome biogenesis GTPase Der n=1 Tax=Candidatus Manganitrophus noduliformans TaxID=2606439 RepID=UPI00143BF6DA|nr:ribosome biogenesis GTPase Der [Candidatus Manganitrophus noduliformans]